MKREGEEDGGWLDSFPVRQVTCGRTKRSRYNTVTKRAAA